MAKLGCIIRPEVADAHAALVGDALLRLPAWTGGPVPLYVGNNIKVGTCAIVAAINRVLEEHWRKTGEILVVPEDLDLVIYAAVTGYDASQTDANGYNPTDQGTDPEALFAWWEQNAILGYKLKSATAINPANINGLKNAVVGGGAYICFWLADNQIGAAEWHPETPNKANGHAVFFPGYIASLMKGISWGLDEAADDAMIEAQGGAAWALQLVAA